MDLKALADSLAGAADINPASYGTVNDTSSNRAEMGNLRNMAALFAGGDIAAQSSNALGAGAAERAAQDEAARRAAAAKKEEEARRAAAELEALQDPKNYRAIINDAGGYDFYDPMGGKISARQYAQVKNMQLTDVYKNSQDPNDQDFIHDYNIVMELGRAVQAGDAKARDKIYEKNPQFKEAYHNWKFEDIVKDLHRNYPEYFRGQEGMNHNAGGKKAEDLELEEEKKKKKNFLQRILGGILG